MQKRLSPFDIEVRQIELDLIEPQADTCQEIALLKAKQAFQQVKQPVLVDDSAFHIPALNGFPGPYVKYILKTLGGNGILKLADGISSRHAYFEGTLTFTTGTKEHKVFTDQSEKGQLSETWRGPLRPDSWSELWNIFVPYGSSKVFAELDDRDRVLLRKQQQRKDLYDLFAEWIQKEYFQIG